ncbi:L,D-transpeptidase family protein [Allobranchiibius huperziae]|uniref:Lipoprotein-anchoring transpeptidase ErfK/SrfK n=1 Tax=Allobranchiibius huperziae TaxID=1874116 RepID=A0A853D6U5_9MICO|nr:L,D-transpeptidase family protein [Allobranchiibius huperziae]NYJ73106.1 lipoprotein-anchoring transpeptidase ErfK/SrfK [Allobranchiibius huperziae]
MTAIDRRTLLATTIGSSAFAIVGGAMLAAPADAATTTRPVLKMGSTGSWVLSAQHAMWNAGYWCGPMDGQFGFVVQQAVWAVQKANAIPTTGEIDAPTWTAIDSQHRAWPRYAGNHIEIDKTRQLLMVARGGRSAITLNTSTGSGRTFEYEGHPAIARTPSGNFKIYRKTTTGWVYGPLGGLYKPYYFVGGIAVHGSPSIPPYPDSHGCCRVSTAAQDYLISGGGLQMSELVYVY